jgi:RNA polymerase sigma factor (sigma-70 family)
LITRNGFAKPSAARHGGRPRSPTLPNRAAFGSRDLDLISARLFCFDSSVLAKDDGASLSTIDPAVAGQNSAVAFATTQWSMVLEAQGESPGAQKALERFCRIYWWPIYGFVRRQGYTPEEAQDLTQGFFALLLERRDLDAVRREKGRLRSYLLTSLKNFLGNARRRATRVKRGEGRPLVPLEELLARESADVEPAHTLSADRIYERCWALTVLEQVLARLDEEYRMAGNATLFGRLKQILADEPSPLSQAEIAQELGMTEHAVKQAFYRLRQRCALLLREQIADTVAAPGDVEDELRHFIAVLQG